MKHKVTPRLHAAILILLGGLLLISVNFCASQLTEHFGLRLDMTSNQLYQLSQQTADILEELEQPVQVQVLSAEGDFLPLVNEIIQEYKRIGQDKIQLQYIDPYTNPTLMDEYLQQGLTVDVGSVVVKGDIYARAIPLSDMFELDSSGQNVESLKCEQQVTSAILYAAGNSSPTAAFTAGHNEIISDGLRDLLVQNNYQVSNVTLSMTDSLEALDLLIIASPSTDFSSDEVEKLDQFLAGGGRMMVFLAANAGQLPNLNEFLTEWGISPTGTVVAEKLQYVDGEPLHIVPIYASHDITRYFADNQIYLVMPNTQALEQVFVSQAGIRTQKLLYSTDRAYAAQGDAGEGAPFTLAMTAEKELESGRARIFVAGSQHMYDDDLLYQDSYSNGKFLSQVMSWCTETESSVSIPPKQLNDASISITLGQVLTLALLLVIALPVGTLIYGFVVYRRRRHS